MESKSQLHKYKFVRGDKIYPEYDIEGRAIGWAILDTVAMIFENSKVTKLVLEELDTDYWKLILAITELNDINVVKSIIDNTKQIKKIDISFERID